MLHNTAQNSSDNVHSYPPDNIAQMLSNGLLNSVKRWLPTFAACEDQDVTSRLVLRLMLFLKTFRYLLFLPSLKCRSRMKLDVLHACRVC